jgi:hypothetical protein
LALLGVAPITATLRGEKNTSRSARSVIAAFPPIIGLHHLARSTARVNSFYNIFSALMRS